MIKIEELFGDGKYAHLKPTHTRRSYNGNNPSATSVHYFNAFDEEVAMYNTTMYDICGITVFKTPRQWSLKAKAMAELPEKLKQSCG